MKINSKKIKSLFLLSLVGSASGKEEKPNNQTEISYPVEMNPKEMFKSINYSWEFAANDEKIADKVPGQNLLAADSSVSLGKLYYGPTMYWNRSLDDYWHLTAEYVYISADLTSVKLFPFVPKTTDEGTTDMIPVISSSDPTSPGFPVCVYGAASGTRCGNIAEIDLNLTVPNPIFKESSDLMLNSLNKVDLGTNGLLSEDIGAPVYAETQIGERTLAQALGHVSVIDNNDPQHQSFYYTPLEQVLDGVSSDHYCTYSLLTYNETEASK
ncbi:11237_t:CDS:2 [Racocetra fulgida]|uniref:11237_t:CDS:1 n=1 Tax=Racocetra fulgida TaxID=60492 RepID=A0A9N8VGR0_9GLOM|nr:11237_t:CDS:2 [Racocetra fulgida]